MNGIQRPESNVTDDQTLFYIKVIVIDHRFVFKSCLVRILKFTSLTYLLVVIDSLMEHYLSVRYLKLCKTDFINIFS